jgi:hypothetical protein
MRNFIKTTHNLASFRIKSNQTVELSCQWIEFVCHLDYFIEVSTSLEKDIEDFDMIVVSSSHKG